MVTNNEAEVYGGPHESGNSVFAIIERGLVQNPDGIAVVAMHQSADFLAELAYGDGTLPATGGCLKWTYTQLHRAALKVAAGLMVQGVEPGMKIMTLVPNGVQFQLMVWLSAILQMTLCPLDMGAVNDSRQEELTSYMNLLQPEVVLVADEKGAIAVDSVLDSSRQHPRVKLCLEASSMFPRAWTSLSSFNTTHAIDTEALLDSARNHVPESRLCMILFTSGTSTGQPKACPRTTRSSCHVLTAQVYGSGFTASSRILQASANFRTIAHSVTTHVWNAGGTAVIPDPARGVQGQIDAIRMHGITYILFIPAILHAMVAHPSFAATDTSSIKDIQIGGDIITRNILVKALRYFPTAQVCNGHGMTEGGGFFKWLLFRSPEDMTFKGEISPIGTVAPGARLRVRDPESGQTVKINEPGEFCASCPSIISGYVGGIFPEAFFEEAGQQWFRTGDVATVDEEGRVSILGRYKDVVKRAGVAITPAALEGCIDKFVGSQTSVIAWPHATLGQEPLVVVEDLNGKTEDDVKAEVLSRFNADSALGPVLTLQQLGLKEFPLNATGKIVKRDLIEAVKEYYSCLRQP